MVSPFNSKHSIDRRCITGVARKAVYGVCRKHDEVTTIDRLNGVGQRRHHPADSSAELKS